MKRLGPIFWALICAAITLAVQEGVAADGAAGRFNGWTGEQYRAYEDSIIRLLYPQPLEMAGCPAAGPVRRAAADSARTAIPNVALAASTQVDMSKEVGAIAISGGVSPRGSRYYRIPIDAPPGIAGFSPKIEIVYDSHSGSSVVGRGWSIHGVPSIHRIGKSVYFDGVTRAVAMDGRDAYALDGNRLVETSKDGALTLYKTETGNILVKCHMEGGAPALFEAFYPDGTKGIFPASSPGAAQLAYPASSMTDLHGNKIDYAYLSGEGLPLVSEIAYGHSKISFSYRKRHDVATSYRGGASFVLDKVLDAVACSYDGNETRAYGFEHDNPFYESMLVSVSLSAQGKSVNPLRFHYGTGNGSYQFNVDSTKVLNWYEFDHPSQLKVAKGRFHYDTGLEGIAVTQNKNPYWRHYRAPVAGKQLAQNRFDNKYDGTEKIFLYTGLKGEQASAVAPLAVGEGFVDMFSISVGGRQDEALVKVNDIVNGDTELLTFHVYGATAGGAIGKLHEWEFRLPTVHTDADRGKSVQPKTYQAGDFDGDGKAEVLAVSTHEPFGDWRLPSQCYLFDLDEGRIKFQGHVFPLREEFVGTLQDDPFSACDSSDKLLSFDYDGDGKIDICHVDDDGLHVYTFESNGESLEARKVSDYDGLTKGALERRMLLAAEMNGDGLQDLLVSPPGEGAGRCQWTLLNSMGDGSFAKASFIGASWDRKAGEGFFIHDVNGDCVSDVVKYGEWGFDVYLGIDNGAAFMAATGAYPKAWACVVPTGANSYSKPARIMGVKGGSVLKYSLTRNDNSESLLTGMVDSRGVLEKTGYGYADAEGVDAGIYTMGAGASFPYVDLQESIPVVRSTELWNGAKLAEKLEYSYAGAVAHRQGRGFCGFSTMAAVDRRGLATIRNYDPMRLGALVSETSPTSEAGFNYDLIVSPDKSARLLLRSKIERNLLTGASSRTDYEYDSHGCPLVENVTFGDGLATRTVRKYANEDIPGDGYNLGFVIDETVTRYRDGAAWSERVSIAAHRLRKPVATIRYAGGNKTESALQSYDTHGNPLETLTWRYSSPDVLKRKRSYDEHGRIASETDEAGLTTAYSYDDRGRVASITDPRGGVTAFTRDAFGRVAAEKGPDGVVSTTRRTWNTLAGGLYAETVSSAAAPTKTTHFDRLGRVVRESVALFNGSLQKVDKVYDDFGRLHKTSLPFLGDEAALWDVIDYDLFDRTAAQRKATGAVVEHSYSGMSTTTRRSGGGWTKKTVDSSGATLVVEDMAGRTVYSLRPDGQPSTIVAPGGVEFRIEYDGYGRRSSVADPGHGNVDYAYDDAGNLSLRIDADGRETVLDHDKYGRIIKKTSPEISTEYAYGEFGDLVSIVSDNGTSTEYEYDALGRLAKSVERGHGDAMLEREYGYDAAGLPASVKYSSQDGYLATEQNAYANGHLSEVTLDGGFTVFRLEDVDDFGQPTAITTGAFTREYGYDRFGFPAFRGARRAAEPRLQNFSYAFDPAGGRLISRTDEGRGIVEQFAYDGLGRLTDYGAEDTAYDNKGNILWKSDVGGFEYDDDGSPYAVTAAFPLGGAIPATTQRLAFNSFSRPASITEGRHEAAFVYNGDGDRVSMTMAKDGSATSTTHYLGGCYEMERADGLQTERLYLGGGFYESPVVLVKSRTYVPLDSAHEVGPAPVVPPGPGFIKIGGTPEFIYLFRDYLGSVTHYVHSVYGLRQELSYDAWGRLRDPGTHATYDQGAEPAPLLGRGYTGHEHLSRFGLVNMNARLYDAALGRFLSPDPFVQDPYSSQNFNRFTYAMNNPLCYVDEDGQFFWMAVGVAAVVSGVVNVATHWNDIKATGGWNGFWKGAGYFGVGALIGGTSAAVGMGSLVGFGSVAGVTFAELSIASSGFVPMAMSGGASGAVGGFISGFGNSLIRGDQFGEAFSHGVYDALEGGLIGAAVGGIIGGSEALIKGQNFWYGAKSPSIAIKPQALTSNDTYSVYYGYDKDNGVVHYVGITKREPQIRFNEHLRSGTNRAQLEYNVFDRTGNLSLLKARIFEQNKINLHGLNKNGGTLYNLRNEISPKYWLKLGITLKK